MQRVAGKAGCWQDTVGWLLGSVFVWRIGATSVDVGLSAETCHHLFGRPYLSTALLVPTALPTLFLDLELPLGPCVRTSSSLGYRKYSCADREGGAAVR